MVTSRRCLAAVLLAVLLLAQRPAAADVSPRTRDYLATRPRDVKDLWKRAREAFDRGAFDDAAACAEAILRLGKEHARVLCLVARCRARAGAPDAARALVDRALELKPGDPESLALARELGSSAGGSPGPGSPSPITLAERLFGTISPDAREAFAAYHADKLDDSLARARAALSSDPGDPAALLARALVHRDMLERQDAEGCLEFLKGRYPRAGFLELLSTDKPDPAREQKVLADIEKDPQADPLALARLAQHKRTLLQCGAARRILDRSRKDAVRPDRETLLAQAGAALSLNDTNLAQEILDGYKTLFGEDSWWMVTRSRLLLAQGQLEESARVGIEAYRKEPRRLALLQQLAGILISAGKEMEFIGLLTLAHEAFPDRKDLEGNFQVLVQLLIRKSRLRAADDGIFHLAVQQGLPPAVVSTVLSTFKDAHRTMGVLFGHFPQRVKLVIFDSIIMMPGALAYFSPLDDTIYVGAVHYRARNADEQNTARTVSEHEYTHYLHTELQRKKGLSQRYRVPVKWLAEGLAEWASRGLEMRLGHERQFMRECLLEGAVPLADLESPVIASNTKSQIKGWYLQGNFMVQYLLGLGTDQARQIDKLVTLSIELVEGMDLDDALKKHFGIDSAAFEKGYKEFIRKEAVRLRKEPAAPAEPAPRASGAAEQEPHE